MDKKLLKLFVCIISALIGGWAFALLHMPIPWLLGPAAAAAIAASSLRQELHCPVSLRNIGLIIIGYSMGASFTKNYPDADSRPIALDALDDSGSFSFLFPAGLREF
jgi:uncharacterized membrane protein AbrB (regulator of aidB expression)